MELLDTNVLAYVHDPTSKNHEKAKRLVKAALKGELKVCVSHQNIAELYSVLTNPLKLSRPYEARTAAELCGSALENGVDTIYTENPRDFEKFKFAKAVNSF